MEYVLFNKDLLELIAGHLSAKDVTRLGATCKKMYALCSRDAIWRRLLLKDFNVTKDPTFDKDARDRAVYAEEYTFNEMCEKGMLSPFKTTAANIRRYGVFLCILNKHLKNIKCCLRRGASVYALGSVMAAVNSGELEILELIVDTGVELDHVNSFGKSPLCVACRSEWKEGAELLLQRGASATIVDAYGQTPLAYAKALGWNDIF